MRKVRIYKDCPLQPDAELELPAPAARHIVQVLRMRPDDPLVLFNGQGGEFAGTLLEVSKRHVRVRTGTKTEPTIDSSLQLTLWHGLCRGSRMDHIVQKATELGVRRIQPVLTERGMVKLAREKAGKRLDHWLQIAISACEQSGRNSLPEIHKPLTLADCLGQFKADHCAIMLDPSGEKTLATAVRKDQPVTILTGPEGGFSPAEIDAAIAGGFRTVALGPRIMRTETAPVVALALVQYLVGDLGADQAG